MRSAPPEEKVKYVRLICTSKLTAMSWVHRIDKRTVEETKASILLEWPHTALEVKD